MKNMKTQDKELKKLEKRIETLEKTRIIPIIIQSPSSGGGGYTVPDVCSYCHLPKGMCRGHFT